MSRDAPSPRNDAKHVLILVMLILHLGRSFASRYISILWYVTDVGKGARVIQQNETFTYRIVRTHTHTHVYIYIFHKSISFFNQSCRSRLNKLSNLFFPQKKTDQESPRRSRPTGTPFGPPNSDCLQGQGWRSQSHPSAIYTAPYPGARYHVVCCSWSVFFFWKDGGDVSYYSLDYQIMIDHNE